MAVNEKFDLSFFKLSSYAENLSFKGKMRYLDKLNGLNEYPYKFPDPYNIPKSEWKDDINLWPPVDFGDVYGYLRSSSNNMFDERTLKNYKSLSAYEYVSSGKVQKVQRYNSEPSSQYCVLIAEVQRSQSITEKNHNPWVILKDNGSVITAHCTCMAGLGEACSHIAALLFKVEMGNSYKNNLTPTDVACKWNNSFSSKKVECTTVDKMEFSKYNWRSYSIGRKVEIIKIPNLPAFTKDELKSLKESCPDSVCVAPLHDLNTSSSSTDTASEDGENDEMPPSILEAIKRINLDSGIKHELMKFFNEENCSNLQNETIGQATNANWIKHRKGRFTSSNFKSIVRRKLWNKDFILKFIYGGKTISSIAMKWGRDNEYNALKSYYDVRSCQHNNFNLERCGLFIAPTLPHLGASPDGLCVCDCCGHGIVEVKCPFTHKDEVDIKKIFLKDKKFCLDKDGFLKKDHEYFYQVQGQLAISRKSYCDFVIWTINDTFIQRILPMPQFWSEIEEVLEDLFYKHMVPVLKEIP